jgi:hypothetical protein
MCQTVMRLSTCPRPLLVNDDQRACALALFHCQGAYRSSYRTLRLDLTTVGTVAYDPVYIRGLRIAPCGTRPSFHVEEDDPLSMANPHRDADAASGLKVSIPRQSDARRAASADLLHRSRFPLDGNQRALRTTIIALFR